MKSFVFGTNVHDTTAGIGLFAFRVVIGLFIAFGHGIGKLPPTEQFMGMVEGMGFPAVGFFAWIAGLVEFGCALLIALGLATRLSALLLALHFSAASFIFHSADPFQAKELAIVYMLCSVLLCFTGGGNYAVDRLIER